MSSELAAAAGRAFQPVGLTRAIFLRHGWRAACLALYFLATSLGHLAFTHWLVAPRHFLGYAYAFKDAVPWGILLGVIGLSAWLVWRGILQKNLNAANLTCWLVWAIYVWGVDHYLTYSIYEYAHYPQYVILAILMGRLLDPARSAVRTAAVVTWSAVLGVIDELMQYLWVTPTYGHYLDFNDFLVNLLAASAGAMIYYGTVRVPSESIAPAKVSGAWIWFVLISAALVLVAGFACGLLAISPPPGIQIPAGGWLSQAEGWGTFYFQRKSDWYGSWREGPYRGLYYVLSPVQALVLMAFAGAVFANFDRMCRGTRHGMRSSAVACTGVCSKSV